MKNVQAVMFPNGGVVTSGEVKEYQTSAEGRNGYMKQSGVEVFASPAGVVRLTPINSKGVVGRGCIEIPNDPAVINEFITALQAVSEEVK